MPRVDTTPIWRTKRDAQQRLSVGVRSATSPVDSTSTNSAGGSISAPPMHRDPPLSVATSPKSSVPQPWRNPDELAYIRGGPGPAAWNDLAILRFVTAYSAFGVPPRPAKTLEQWMTIRRIDGSEVVLPRAYRLPLMWVAKFLWTSLRLVLGAHATIRAREWDGAKFEILHVARLCATLLDAAAAQGQGRGMERGWRCAAFDRALRRYYYDWLIMRDEFVRDFFREFGEEEYEGDVLKLGHKGFTLTKEEVAKGITADEFVAGLVVDENAGTFEWSEWSTVCILVLEFSFITSLMVYFTFEGDTPPENLELPCECNEFCARLVNLLVLEGTWFPITNTRTELAAIRPPIKPIPSSPARTAPLNTPQRRGHDEHILDSTPREREDTQMQTQHDDCDAGEDDDLEIDEDLELLYPETSPVKARSDQPPAPLLGLYASNLPPLPLIWPPTPASASAPPASASSSASAPPASPSWPSPTPSPRSCVSRSPSPVPPALSRAQFSSDPPDMTLASSMPTQSTPSSFVEPTSLPYELTQPGDFVRLAQGWADEMRALRAEVGQLRTELRAAREPDPPLSASTNFELQPASLVQQPPEQRGMASGGWAHPLRHLLVGREEEEEDPMDVDGDGDGADQVQRNPALPVAAPHTYAPRDGGPPRSRKFAS
ncbi:hypothetical protein C8R43DRAFT_1193430 [Mycena crocata]|nr:hypothetical protein C8R43DRAFT_1193430 [Mycena crocata]